LAAEFRAEIDQPLTGVRTTGAGDDGFDLGGGVFSGLGCGGALAGDFGACDGEVRGVKRRNVEAAIPR
jgi:hypothetical protein